MTLICDFPVHPTRSEIRFKLSTANGDVFFFKLEINSCLRLSVARFRSNRIKAASVKFLIIVICFVETEWTKRHSRRHETIYERAFLIRPVYLTS